MLDFFEAIFSNHSGLVPVGRMSLYEGGARKLNKTEWFHWPEQKEQLVAFCESYADEDVYFSPQLYTEQKRIKDNVSIAPVLWADADEAHPSKFKLAPSIIVESSPNKYQLYWFIEGSNDPSWHELASRRIAYEHRDEGCDTGWALTKYLRVPKTTNTKYDVPSIVKYVNHGTVYDVEDFVEQYGDPNVITQYERDREFPEDLPTIDEALAAISGRISTFEADLIGKRPLKDWSTALWTLECSLARLGIDRATAFVVIRNSQCNKYLRDGRPESDLWEEVCRAYEVVEEELDQEIELPAPTIKEKRAGSIKLLTDDERKKTLRDTFITRYTAWASAKTKADTNYHVMSAQCLLSTVFADFGHAVPQFGNLNLNLWFMLLGQTTNTFKTTARKLMINVLKKLEDMDSDNYHYDLGSDATTEGLLEDLYTRPRRSGLFYRDEAQGLIGDSMGNKTYLTGLHTTFTELYDGHVRGVVRAGGRKRKSVPTSMSMYLMGVPNEMANNLTVDDFKSGFLARMLFYIGVPAERDRLRQASSQEDVTIDVGFDRLVDELFLARRFWEAETNAGDTIPIVCRTAAWERFNDLLDDLAEITEGDEILMAASLRMGMSTLKLACLLAMVDEQKKVSLEHMLTAIEHCELWYSGLQQMSSMVATSLWQGELDEVITHLYANERMSYAALYKKFQGKYKPREFQEIITALTDSGDISLELTKNNGRYLKARI